MPMKSKYGESFALLLPEPRLVKCFKGETELAKKESEKKSSMAMRRGCALVFMG
jgi:hypothetical protein